MFGWFRKKKAVPPTPAAAAKPAPTPAERWASYLTPAQQQRFEQLVRAHFAQRGVEVAWGHGSLRIGTTEYGLDNVAQRCRPMPDDEWALVIAEHFDRIASAESESAELHARQHDFAWMATQLLVRIYPADMQLPAEVAGASTKWGTWREDLQDTRSMLVVDRPSTVVSLDPDLPRQWGRRRDELFALALQNVAAQCPVEVEDVELDRERGVRATVLSADHLFVAAHALRLDAFAQVLGPHGTLFCVPNRHTLIALPITTLAATTAAVQRLLQLAMRMYADGPGSTSPHVYWRTPAGAFAVVRGRLDGTNLHVLPSDAFTELLGRLPA
jgi:hypothetical protein